MTESPRDVLKKAREAHQSGDYAQSLEMYQAFYERALETEPSLSGVRLSYCLAEWAMLGEQYPEARARLERKRDEALALLKETRDPTHFHDFASICKYLDTPHLPVEFFLQTDAEDSAFAETLARFIWDSLAEEELWDICNAYMPDAAAKYEEALQDFDYAVDLIESGQAGGPADFKQLFAGRCADDITTVLRILKETGQLTKLRSLQTRAAEDLKKRGFAELGAHIDEDVTA